MKRLRIAIEDDLDAALEQQAEEEGMTKAALVRRYLLERLGPFGDDDPLWAIAAMIKGGRADDSARIDDVVYG